MSTQALLEHTGARLPIICGAMYPCSNPELVGAVAAAGAMAIVQPISLTYVYGYDFREGLRFVNSLSSGGPIGLNLLVEASSKIYLERNKNWLDIALDEGVRFFITALGNPKWVVERVHERGGFVYHDVTSRKWAQKAVDAGVDGLICVNNRAGGHAGELAPETLISQMKDFGLPIVCAGGVGSENEFVEMMSLGYAGVQMGTRFIASKECKASDAYKQAILRASARDVVMSVKLTGVPVSVIENDYVKKQGRKMPAWLSRLSRIGKAKHLIRMYYSLMSLWRLKKSIHSSSEEYWQAGKSVETIHEIEKCESIISRFSKAWKASF